LSYLVLARKWRPKQFDDVVGQKAITQTLKNAILSGRIAHAYLFSGQRGVGKTTTARVLAKALNCEKGPTPQPCDACHLCEEINRGNSLDVIEIDGASNNSVDDIRDLREKVHYIPAKGRYKVYIIDEVHMLSKPAFNALLKTLEEPPAHVVFILATTEAHKIPITIISRCQRYDFRRISCEDIRAYLDKLLAQEGGLQGEKDAALRLIAKTADGSLRDALSLIDQVISLGSSEITLQQVLDLVSLVDYHTIGEMMAAAAAGNAREALTRIEQVIERGHDVKHFVEQILGYLRDTIILKIGKEDEKALNMHPEEAGEMASLAGSLSLDDLLRHFDLLAGAVERMKWSSQPRIILEMAVIRMAELPRLQPVEELIHRLDLLETAQGMSEVPGHACTTFEPDDPGPSPPVPEQEAAAHPSAPEMLTAGTTPVSAPAPPSVQHTGDGLNWEGVVQHVKGASMMFGSVLEHLQCTHDKDANALELSLKEENPFYARLIDDNKNQAILREALAKAGHGTMDVRWASRQSRVLDVEQPKAEDAPETPPSPKPPVQRSLDLINREPIIQRAMDIFSAQIISTRLAEDGADEEKNGV